MTKKISYTIGNGSHKGMVRSINQDSFGSAKNSWGEFFIVADGMGGHKGGEVASKMVVNHLCEAFKLEQNGDDPARFFQSTIQSANQAVLEKAKDDSEYEGMGTTVVCVVIKGNDAYFAHVGDSRIYLFRYSKPIFITKDHSVVQDLLDKGLITPAEAKNHPKKNRILQAVGTGTITPTINRKSLYKGDTLLLCSDGLTGEVSDKLILSTLKKNDPKTASKMLIDLANKNGGSDNITCIVLNVDNGLNPPKKEKYIPKGSGSAPQSSMPKIIYAISGLLIGIGITIAGFKIYDGYVTPLISGCMDTKACNYNSEAKIDDGNCSFPEECWDESFACDSSYIEFKNTNVKYECPAELDLEKEEEKSDLEKEEEKSDLEKGEEKSDLEKKEDPGVK